METIQFGKTDEDNVLPDLVELQTKSFHDFLQADIPFSERSESGLEAIIREIYQALDLPDIEPAMEAIRGHIEAQDSYQKNIHELPDGIREKINQRWAFAFEQWGYEVESDT